jgi:hypothetical protein
MLSLKVNKVRSKRKSKHLIFLVVFIIARTYINFFLSLEGLIALLRKVHDTPF